MNQKDIKSRLPKSAFGNVLKKHTHTHLRLWDNSLCTDINLLWLKLRLGTFMECTFFVNFPFVCLSLCLGFGEFIVCNEESVIWAFHGAPALSPPPSGGPNKSFRLQEQWHHRLLYHLPQKKHRGIMNPTCHRLYIRIFDGSNTNCQISTMAPQNTEY